MLIQLLIAKEWLQSVVSAIALILGFAAIWGISALISGSGNDTLIMSMMSNGTSVGTGLLPDFYAAMASFLTVAGPRRTRSGTKWGWNILYTVAVLFVVLSWNSLSGVLVSFAAGRALGMLIRFMLGTQTNGAWGQPGGAGAPFHRHRRGVALPQARDLHRFRHAEDHIGR